MDIQSIVAGFGLGGISVGAFVIFVGKRWFDSGIKLVLDRHLAAYTATLKAANDEQLEAIRANWKVWTDVQLEQMKLRLQFRGRLLEKKLEAYQNLSELVEKSGSIASSFLYEMSPDNMKQADAEMLSRYQQEIKRWQHVYFHDIETSLFELAGKYTLYLFKYESNLTFAITCRDHGKITEMKERIKILGDVDREIFNIRGDIQEGLGQLISSIRESP